MHPAQPWLVLCTHSSFNSLVKASVCISLSLLYPHDLWTNGPVAGTRSKSGALWDKLVLQMGKRDALWYKVKSYGRNSYSEDRSLSRKICALTYGRDQSAVAPYQADKSWRHKSVENQIAKLKCSKLLFIFKQTVCVYYGLPISARCLCSSWKEAWQRCVSDDAGPALPFPGKVIMLHVRRSVSFVLWSSWELQEEKHGNM